MKVPEERRVELRAEALQRIAESRENDFRRFLLAECVQAYMHLDAGQWQEFQDLLTTDKRFQGAKTMMTTVYEQGVEKGLEQGMEQGLRQALERQLKARFGPLGDETQTRLNTLSLDEVEGMLIAVLTAKSLQELGLDD